MNITEQEEVAKRCWFRRAWQWFIATDDEATDLLNNLAVLRKLVLGLLALVLLLYVMGTTSLWYPARDGASYLGVGRNLAEGKGFVFNGATRYWFSPGIPFVWAFIVSVFGEQYIVANAVMTCFSLLAAGMTFLVLRMLVSKRVAVIVSLMVLCSYACFYRGLLIETDIVFLAMFMVAIWGYYAFLNGRNWGLLAIVGGCIISMLFRIPGMLLYPGLIVGMCLERHGGPGWRKKVAVGLSAGMVFAMVIAWTALQLDSRAEQSKRVMSHAEQPGDTVEREEPMRGYLTHAQSVMSNGPGVVLKRVSLGLMALPRGMARLVVDLHGPSVALLPLFMVFLVGMIHDVRRGRMVPTCTVAGGGLALALLVGPQGTRGRYVLPLLPWVLYFGLMGGVIVIVSLRKWIPRKRLRQLTLVFILAIIGAGLGKDVRDVALIYRSEGPWILRHHWARVDALRRWVLANTSKGDILLAREDTVLCYWTRRRFMPLDKRSNDVIGDILRQLNMTNVKYLIVGDDEADKGALEKKIIPAYRRYVRIDRYTIYRRNESIPVPAFAGSGWTYSCFAAGRPEKAKVRQSGDISHRTRL